MRDERDIRHVRVIFWVYLALIVAGIVVFSVVGLAYR